MPKPMTEFEAVDTDNQLVRARCGASGAAIETAVRRRHRRFSEADKLRIVQAAELAAASGERGALGKLKRQEGVYSSQLAAWRKQFASDPQGGLKARKRGRKPKAPDESVDVQKLLREKALLEHKLQVANALIELQKKAQSLLCLEFPEAESDEKP